MPLISDIFYSWPKVVIFSALKKIDKKEEDIFQ